VADWKRGAASVGRQSVRCLDDLLGQQHARISTDPAAARTTCLDGGRWRVVSTTSYGEAISVQRRLTCQCQLMSSLLRACILISVNHWLVWRQVTEQSFDRMDEYAQFLLDQRDHNFISSRLTRVDRRGNQLGLAIWRLSCRLSGNVGEPNRSHVHQCLTTHGKQTSTANI